MRRWVLGAAACLVLSSPAGAATYIIQNLGTGWTPAGINDNGLIVGNSYQTNNLRGVTWQSGCTANCLTSIGNFGISFAQAAGINNLGQIVGTYDTIGASGYPVSRGFSLHNNILTDIGEISVYSAATAVNKFGQIVGSSIKNGGNTTSILYDQGIRDIDSDVLQGMYSHIASYATGINDSGLVIGDLHASYGSGSTASYIYDIDTDLYDVIYPQSSPSHPGRSLIVTTDINNSGDVVGWAEGYAFQVPPRGFLYSNGAFADLPAEFSRAYSINDLGQIVGHSEFPSARGLILLDSGTVTHWSDLLGDSPGWSLTTGAPSFINRSGQIAGVGYLNGIQHAFLMTPTIHAAHDSDPATVPQLAEMAENAYLSTPGNDVGLFQNTGFSIGSRSSQHSIFAEAYVSPGLNGGRNQVVIAIRGTAGFLDHELRNGTFLTGTATPGFAQSADEIAVFVRSVNNVYPGADFTLTGHSLGGALAQAVAEAIQVDAIGFDTPGANGAFDASAQMRLAVLANGIAPVYSATTVLSSVRYFGDEISKLGNPYLGVQTVVPTDTTLLNKIADRTTLLGSCWFLCHEMWRLRDELVAGNQPLAGIPDIYSGLGPPVAGLVDALTLAKRFDQQVDPSTFFLFDPAGYGHWVELNMLDSDVELSAMFLPSFSDELKVFARLQDAWVSVGTFDGFSAFAVPASRLYRIGDASALQDREGNFLLGLQFSSIGTFRGSISLVEGSGIPEPDTWLMMILGFGAVGFWLRRSKQQGTSIARNYA